MSAVENLKAARAWLAEGEHRWAQRGWYGYDKEGCGCGPRKAASCCAIGALAHVKGEARYFAASFGNEAGFLELACGEHVPNFNDAPTTTYADILALYDRAIELAEQAEGGAS